MSAVETNSVFIIRFRNSNDRNVSVSLVYYTLNFSDVETSIVLIDQGAVRVGYGYGDGIYIFIPPDLKAHG